MQWTDVEEIAKSLEENYPEESILELSIQDIDDLIKSLEEFEDNETIVNKAIIEEIQEAWVDIRNNTSYEMND